MLADVSREVILSMLEAILTIVIYSCLRLGPVEESLWHGDLVLVLLGQAGVIHTVFQYSFARLMGLTGG
jgi:hypothetical protein